MRFLTESECDSWVTERGWPKPNSSNSRLTERILFPKEAPRLLWWSRRIATACFFAPDPVLLWITEWGIWGDEAQPIYDRVRQSYGDQRLLPDAPGHLFVAHEREDLGTFLQLAVLNGWGGYILSHTDYLSAFFSHDEYRDFFADDQRVMETVTNELRC